MYESIMCTYFHSAVYSLLCSRVFRKCCTREIVTAVSEGCKLFVEGSEPRTPKTGEHVFRSLNKEAEEL